MAKCRAHPKKRGHAWAGSGRNRYCANCGYNPYYGYEFSVEHWKSVNASLPADVQAMIERARILKRIGDKTRRKKEE